MPRFEYKVVPAPRKGLKAKGVKSSEDRFAHALATLMNAEARDGWEYLRTDTLPMQERKGLTGTTTTYQNMLVFRRALSEAAASLTPGAAIPAETATAAAAPVEAPAPIEPAPAPTTSPKLVVKAEEGAAPPVGPARGERDSGDEDDARDRLA